MSGTLVSLIVAMDRDDTIGRDGRLPWRLPADLRNFKQITMGKPIVMGRKTHESIGCALPGRDNLVVSRSESFRAAGCTVVNSLDDALARIAGAPEVMVIGGASIYAAALPIALKIYLTEVHAAIGGDVHFPEFDRGAWHETSRQGFDPDHNHQHPYSFVVLERQESYKRRP